MSLTAFLDPAYAADLDALEEVQRDKARTFARECRLYASLASRTTGYGWKGSAPTDSMVMEAAGTCLIGQGTAAGRLVQAQRLVDDLPGLLTELEAGRVFVPQAMVLLDETRNLSPQLCALVEMRVLRWARELAPGPLRKKVKALVLEVDAEEAARRAAAAKADRDVTFRSIEDDQALLITKGSADELRRLDLWLAAQARALIADGDPRTIGQIKYHLLVQRHLAAAGSAGAKPITAVIHVPVATSLGISDQPGTLEGYGPLSASTTRQLLTEASLVKVCVDTVTGRVVGAERKPRPSSGGCPETLRKTLLEMVLTTTTIDHGPEAQHDPSAALVREIALRDQGCDGVGCSVSASQCERDHKIPWPEGPTSFDNLINRSQRCHHAKHNGWNVVSDVDGTSHWTSPAGRTYTVHTRDRPPPLIAADVRLPSAADLATRDARLLEPPCPTCLRSTCACPGQGEGSLAHAA
jgi:hypothetical protein